MYLWFFWQTQTFAAFSSTILCFKFLALFENCLNLENVLSNCLAVSRLVHFWLSVYICDIYLRKNLSCLENTVQNEMNPTEQYVTSRIHIYLPSFRPYPDFWNIFLVYCHMSIWIGCTFDEMSHKISCQTHKLPQFRQITEWPSLVRTFVYLALISLIFSTHFPNGCSNACSNEIYFQN